MTCKVSVLVPSYNYASKIGQCIESVLAQDCQELELVVSDDASTDDSDAVIRRYRDPRLRYQRQPVNLGMVPNWRKCVELSQGQYLLLLGADDYLKPGMIRHCLAALESDPQVAFCHTATEFFTDDGKITATTGAFQRSYLKPGTELIESFLQGRRAVASSVVFRRSCWQELGGWSSDFRNCMDIDLWFRMLLRWKVAYVGKVLVGFRAHAVAPSWQIMQSEEDLRFLDSMFERLPPSHAGLRALQPALRANLSATWRAALLTLPVSDSRDAALSAMGGAAASDDSTLRGGALRRALRQQGTVWLSKLPDQLRYALGDCLRIAG